MPMKTNARRTQARSLPERFRRIAPILGAAYRAPRIGAIQKSVFTPAYRKLIRLLVDARTKANLSQRQLAAKLGCHHSWVAKVELGERRLDVIEFVRLVRALGKDPAKTLAAVARHVR